MTDTDFSHHTLPSLRRAVRRLARAHRLPTELRARLVLSAVDLARTELTAGRPVRLEASVEPSSGGSPGHLVVTLETLGDLTVGYDEGTVDLALPAQITTGGTAIWRLPLPAPREEGKAGATGDGDASGSGSGTGVVVPSQSHTGRAESGDGSRPAPEAPDAPDASKVPETPETPETSETEAVEQELRAALARIDALTAEHRRLKHELAETNRGTLALYVQLEERDEQLRKAHGQTLRELEDALRPSPIEVKGLEMAVHYAPAGTDAPTGGDLYDWLQLPDGTVHITVVDALGHGVTSTRGALNVTHAVRTLALEGHPLESIVARTAEILMPFDSELMSTVLLARIDPKTGDLYLANGSHPPALLLPAEGEPRYLEVRGRGIGYPLAGSERLLHTKMAPGDLLVLYTDGLTESRRDPREGETRLVEAARRHAERPIEHIPGAIAEDMHTIILHPDDTLALAVRVPRD
ncbi:SpoIIE family protein phosphatase [Streptomyces sp. TRM43335]|uniref:SpoIIE family protein phosphatase n=1 Tax=Streptomyces taklimakanensis TaxID=2569853 RepID=A0A6G2BIF7_9ACTN|nr:PP2C family protein-serine/threonine phosphatase [Streptomyces taklimakanensis]MTE22030.1 SpoIIE family protein phosphatase [Streptomyces taklimakanensis]